MGKICKHEEYLVLTSGAKPVVFSKNLGCSKVPLWSQEPAFL